jgi:gluconokinase
MNIDAATTAAPLPTALVVMGVAGSGKSTLAQALATHYHGVFLDADDFHSAAAKAQMAAGSPLTDAQRVPWVRALAAALQRHAAAGERVVLAFSGLRREHRALLRACGVPLRFVFLHAPAAVIAARLAARGGHFMPATLLDSQFSALQPPGDEADVVAVDVSAAPASVLAEAIAKLERLPESS